MNRSLLTSNQRREFVLDRLQRKRSGVTQYDHGLNTLAPFRIWDTDYRDRTDRRMRPENIFNFARINVKTARNDHVFGTINDIDKPVLIAAGEITRVKPAMAKRLRSLFRFVTVSKHHQGPTDTDFTHFTDGDLQALIVQKL